MKSGFLRILNQFFDLFSSVEYEIGSEKFNWGIEEYSASNLNALKHAFSKCVDDKYIDQFKYCYNKVSSS